MSFYVQLVCDAVNEIGDRCWTEDTYGSPRTAAEARRRLGEQGWHRTRDGRDICPDCWAEGRR